MTALNMHSWGQNSAWTVNSVMEANINSTQPTQIFGQQKMFAQGGNTIPSSKGYSSFFSKEHGRKRWDSRVSFELLSNRCDHQVEQSNSYRCGFISCQNSISQLMLLVSINHHMKCKFRHFQHVAKAKAVKQLWAQGFSFCPDEDSNTCTLPKTLLG